MLTELTCDCGFQKGEEEGKNEVPCGCGAPNCCGTLN